MNTQKKALIHIILSIVLAVVSWIVLPENVVTQITISHSLNTVPKFLAILIPTAIGIGFGILQYKATDDSKQLRYGMASSIGIVVFIIMLAINIIQMTYVPY